MAWWPSNRWPQGSSPIALIRWSFSSRTASRLSRGSSAIVPLTCSRFFTSGELEPNCSDLVTLVNGKWHGNRLNGHAFPSGIRYHWWRRSIPVTEELAMLVRFSVENLLSFRERVELSMVASAQEHRNPDDVIWPSTSDGIALLKLAIIYGANASGKSNLVKAMSIARDLILYPAAV